MYYTQSVLKHALDLKIMLDVLDPVHLPADPMERNAHDILIYKPPASTECLMMDVSQPPTHLPA